MSAAVGAVHTVALLVLLASLQSCQGGLHGVSAQSAQVARDGRRLQLSGGRAAAADSGSGPSEEPAAFCARQTRLGFFPDVPSGCTRFYRCEVVGAYSFRCPSQTLWDQELLTCNWAYNVDCSGWEGDGSNGGNAGSGSSPSSPSPVRSPSPSPAPAPRSSSPALPSPSPQRSPSPLPAPFPPSANASPSPAASPAVPPSPKQPAPSPSPSSASPPPPFPLPIGPQTSSSPSPASLSPDPSQQQSPDVDPLASPPPAASPPPPSPQAGAALPSPIPRPGDVEVDPKGEPDDGSNTQRRSDDDSNVLPIVLPTVLGGAAVIAAVAAATLYARRQMKPGQTSGQPDVEAPASPGPASTAAAAPAEAAPAAGGAASPSAAFQHVLDETDEEIVGWHWTGSDEFSVLEDRRDAPPLPLPPLDRSTRVVLVRHGQSTWNARNRIQGSSNFSVLTEKGVEQARAANKLLEGWDFTRLFYSPLKRAAQTADIVWGGRPGATSQLACLREIDLYSFQGLDKIENRQQYPEQYNMWQNNPAQFIIDDHAPVRELWYRASLAWREVLGAGSSSGIGNGSGNASGSGQTEGAMLVVAHNAVNQALLCTALGLPPSFFRRFSQSNASFTVLDFEVEQPGSSSSSSGSSGAADGSSSAVGGGTSGLRVRVERVNQFPDKPLNPSKLGKSLPNRLVLIAGTAGSPEVQASIQMLQSVGVASPPLIGIGSPAQQALDIHTAMQAALSTPGDGRTIVAVACAEACQRMLGDCLGPVDPSAPAEEQQRSAAQVGAAFSMAEGGMTIVNWPQGQDELGRGTVLCVNYQLPATGPLLT